MTFFNKKNIQIGIAALITFMVLTFNNCGQFKANLNTQVATQNSTTPIEQNDPVALSITAGQAVAPSLLSKFVNATGVNSDQNDYLASNGFKAIAVSADNQILYVFDHPRQMGLFQNQDETDKAAIERCNIITKRACTILAEGNSFKQNESALASTMINILSAAPASFDANLVPGLNLVAKSNLSEYLSWANNKALTISVNGVYAIAQSTVSLDEAKRVSLEFCQATSGGYPCFFYAENGNIVFNPANILTQSPLAFSGTLNQSIPFLNDANKASLYNSYISDLTNYPNAVLVVGDDGSFKYYRSSNIKVEDLITQAMAACQSALSTKLSTLNSSNPNFKVINRYRCYLYAVKTQVMLTRESLK